MRPFDHLLAPMQCCGCDSPGTALCLDCRMSVTLWHSTACRRCGGDWFERCLCARLPDAVESVHALWQYSGALVEVIEGAKSDGELWRLAPLRREARAWLTGLGQRASGATVVPVPAHPARLRRRGFDLPARFASWLARGGTGRLRLDGLRRSGALARSVGRGRRERLAGDEWIAPRPVRGHVVVVDDVITTGGTIAGCCQALAGAGAERITAVSLVRTPSLARRAGAAAS